MICEVAHAVEFWFAKIGEIHQSLFFWGLGPKNYPGVYFQGRALSFREGNLHGINCKPVFGQDFPMTKTQVIQPP